MEIQLLLEQKLNLQFIDVESIGKGKNDHGNHRNNNNKTKFVENLLLKRKKMSQKNQHSQEEIEIMDIPPNQPFSKSKSLEFKKQAFKEALEDIRKGVMKKLVENGLSTMFNTKDYTKDPKTIPLIGGIISFEEHCSNENIYSNEDAVFCLSLVKEKLIYEEYYWIQVEKKWVVQSYVFHQSLKFGLIYCGYVLISVLFMSFIIIWLLGSSGAFIVDGVVSNTQFNSTSTFFNFIDGSYVYYTIAAFLGFFGLIITIVLPLITICFVFLKQKSMFDVLYSPHCHVLLCNYGNFCDVDGMSYRINWCIFFRNLCFCTWWIEYCECFYVMGTNFQEQRFIETSEHNEKVFTSIQDETCR